MTRLFQSIFVLAAALPCGAAGLSEDFAADPIWHGWRVFGDATLFTWNETNQNLEVTWDSSHTNSFFYRPLGTVLAKSDDFSFSFDLRLRDIQVGRTPGKSNEFEIAIGLLHYRSATNADFFRGAGVNSTYGVRNVFEFDYFPDAGFGDTWATTVVSSNNVFAFAHDFPLTLSPTDVFRITLAYTASNELVRATATKNGAPFGPLADLSLAGKPDFRLDSFAVISYSDSIQSGPPAFHGSVLAHGTVDNLTLVVPDPPLLALRLGGSNDWWGATFQSQTNWVYTLERSPRLQNWSAASATVPGNGGALNLSDDNIPGPMMFYRVRAERP